MKRLLVLAALLMVSTLGSAQSVPAGLKVLGCTNGGSTYTTVAPTAGTSMNVSPNASGAGASCGLPASFPATSFVKTTVDNGKTWQWTYRLSDLFPAVVVTPPPQTTVQGTLSWTAPTTNDDGSPLTDLATYNVYEDVAQIGSVPAGTTSFSLGSLTIGETHTFGVTALNALGVSSTQATITYTVQAVVKPKVPGSPTNPAVTVK